MRKRWKFPVICIIARPDAQDFLTTINYEGLIRPLLRETNGQ